MNFFKRVKAASIISKKNDEIYYAMVANEMATGVRNKAQWTKALALADGSDEKQVARYIKLRVASLKDDVELGKIILSEIAEDSTDSQLEPKIQSVTNNPEPKKFSPVLKEPLVMNIRNRVLCRDLFTEKKAFIEMIGGSVSLEGVLTRKVIVSLSGQKKRFPGKADFCRWVYLNCKKLVTEHEALILSRINKDQWK